MVLSKSKGAFHSAAVEPSITLFSKLSLRVIEGQVCGRHEGLQIACWNPDQVAWGLNPGPGYCVVFLGEKLESHSSSVDLGVYRNKFT